MDATPSKPGPHGATLAPRQRERPASGPESTRAADRKWSALLDAAGVVASIAGLPRDTRAADARDFPAVMRDAAPWRRALAEQGIEDLTAIMEPGLSALLNAHARGVDPASAAEALWREFIAARDALLALAPPPEH